MLLALFAPSIPSTAQAQQPAAPAAPARAEKLYYEVTFSAATVAQVNIFTGCPKHNNTPAALYAVSKGLAAQLHSFAIRFDTFLANTEPWPLAANTEITETGQTRTYATRFISSKLAKVTSQVARDTKQTDIALPKRSHDMLSWLLHFRQRQQWAKDERERYFVWDGWKLFKLEATIERQTSLETPLGTYDVWSVRLDRTRYHHSGPKLHTPINNAEQLGRVYFTTDASHKPVGIDFSAKVGQAYIRLAKYDAHACAPPSPATR